jgi:hypothetical protein
MAASMENSSNKINFRELSDEEFLAQCRLEVFRGSGPGGQKRNKTSSAVRLVHVPTGMTATAADSRSQAQNRGHALQRLRHQMTLEIRLPFDGKAVNLDVSMRSDEYLPTVGALLDALSESGWSISETAPKIGASTSPLSAFFRRDEKLWAYVNQQRKKAGLKGLI